MQRSARPGPDGWTGPQGRGAPDYDWDPADPPTDPRHRSGPGQDWDAADPRTDSGYPSRRDYDWDPAGPAAGPEHYGTPPQHYGTPDYGWDPGAPANGHQHYGALDYEGADSEPEYDWGPAPVTDSRYRGRPGYTGPNSGWDPADPAGGPGRHSRPEYASPDADWGYADPAGDPRRRGTPEYASPDADWDYADPAGDPRRHSTPGYASPDADWDPGDLDGDPQRGDDQRPGRRRRGRQRRRRRYPPLRQRLWFRIALGLLATFLAITAWSVGNALTVPGGGTVSDRLAEWARDHYLGPVVTFGEWLTYRAPKVGGKPSFALTGPAAAPTHPAKLRKKTAASFAPPAPLQSLAGKPLQGEGQWRVLANVHGIPAIYGTDLRASSVYSSYVSGIVSLNQNLIRFQLRPGSEDPGPGNWKAADWIPPGTRLSLLATFNSGFKIAQSGGGFYLNGATAGTLTKGVASVVYYRNGHIAIGVWGQTVRMTPDVVGVRQNLHLIIDNGTIPASVDSNVVSSWGATLGGGYYVWRSGIGITKDGRIIFAYGPALNVRELAGLLKRAGAVTAMQLDINPEWMSFMYYLPGHHPANPTPVALLPNQMQAANRYYSINGRDFTAVYAR